MKFLLHSFCVFLFSASVYAEPTIRYEPTHQRYTFPELTVPAVVFFSELSQYSGIDIYYHPDLIIPDIFRGISLQENELLNLLDKKFSLIKAFQSQQLASLRILPAGKFQSDVLRRANNHSTITYSQGDLQNQPVQLSANRIRVLKAKEQRTQSLADIEAKQIERKEREKKKQEERKKIREQKHLAYQQKELHKLKKFHDTDAEIYQRLLPFYQHRYGKPDFSIITETETTNNPIESTASYD